MFLISAFAIVLAGTRLSRDGDRIAEITGLGGVWIGAILVAAATSLPELATDVYAVHIGAGNLALGDLFGSNMANMLILGVVDTLHRQTRLLQTVAGNQSLLCVIAVMVTAVAAFGMVWPDFHSFLGLSWSALAVMVTYLAGMRLLYQRPAMEETLGIPDEPRGRRPLVRALLGFAAATLVILVAARYLASSARDIAQMLGLGTGFVGMLLVGLTTSLPEFVVSLASVRIGAYDLAVGNLFGSNAFNMAIIVVLDLANGKAPILAFASPDLLLGALIGIFMMGVALMGVLYRAETRFWKLEPDTLLLILLYVLGMGLLYRESRAQTRPPAAPAVYGQPAAATSMTGCNPRNRYRAGAYRMV